MNNTILINTLYLLIPFTIYGLIKFNMWWFKKVWTKPGSFGVMMVIGSLSPTWALYTLIMIHNNFPKEVMPIYAFWTLFAPISMIVGMIASVKNKDKKYSNYAIG